MFELLSGFITLTDELQIRVTFNLGATQSCILGSLFGVKVLCCVCRQQILGDTKLIIGCPMISSAGNMKFWLYLCQASSLAGSERAVAPFQQAAETGKESLAAYCQQYNADLVQKVGHSLVQHAAVACHSVTELHCGGLRTGS